MRERCPYVVLVLLATGATGCATSPPLCPDKHACREDPTCTLVTDVVEGPKCMSQQGCASVARMPIAPCPKDLPVVALEQFLANPTAHAAPVTLSGILVPRAPFCQGGNHPMEWPEGSCPLSCRAILALVPEAKAGTHAPPGKDLRIRGNDYAYQPGVAVIPAEGGRLDGPFLCHGDDSAVCCAVPIDGRRVAVTFDRARVGTRDWFNKMSDRDDLMFSSMCSLGS
jgi:hypothetical protein